MLTHGAASTMSGESWLKPDWSTTGKLIVELAWKGLEAVKRLDEVLDES